MGYDLKCSRISFGVMKLTLQAIDKYLRKNEPARQVLVDFFEYTCLVLN